MNISPRTQTLIDLLPKNHPLTPSMRDAIIAASAAGEGFAGHKIALASDGRMTPRGQSQALQEALTTTHGKRWARAKSIVAKARAEHKARKAALVTKDVDFDGIDSLAKLARVMVGENRREEIRKYLIGLDPNLLMVKAQTTEDVRILESMLLQAPELSGFAGIPAKIAEEIEQRYIALVNPRETAELEALDAVIVPAEQACHIARNELRSTLDNNMHQRDFDDLMRPIETIRPWLIDDGKQVCEIGADGKPSYRQANETDRAFGVRYKDVNEYRAATGMADAA
jgi:hypothetical protein